MKCEGEKKYGNYFDFITLSGFSVRLAIRFANCIERSNCPISRD